MNKNHMGPDGNWKRNNAPFSTYPCNAQEALNLAVAIQEKLRGDWRGLSGTKDGVDLGLAARVLEAYHDIYNTQKVSVSWWRRLLRKIAAA